MMVFISSRARSHAKRPILILFKWTHYSMVPHAGRFFWILAGLFFLGLGIAGYILPLLPGTVFLLLATFCFSRGSERLHSWLLNHKYLGPSIRDWNEHGVIPIRAKILATLMMIGAVVAAYLMHAPKLALIAQMMILPCVGLFIWTRPSAPKEAVPNNHSSGTASENLN